MPSVKVIKPGFQTTVQDGGRPHYAHFGISASGAADDVSFRIANMLVGNSGDEAALEMTLVGGQFGFEADCAIAITGSDFQPKVDGKEVSPWRTIFVRSGQDLAFGATIEGARCYLAIQGGFDIPKVLGSRSTHVMTGVGGHMGRALSKGDLLPYRATNGNRLQLRRLKAEFLGFQLRRRTLRVTEGPQADSFSEKARQTITTSLYSVSEDSNRMGIRLNGPSLNRVGEEDIITEGVSLGAVQVSHDGKPIILFVEHQTTGGYPKIANVISADLHTLGQLRPRDEVQFEFVSLEEADSLRTDLESHISERALIAL